MPKRGLNDLTLGELRILANLWEHGEPATEDFLADIHDLHDFDEAFKSLLDDGFIEKTKAPDEDEWLYGPTVTVEEGDSRSVLSKFADVFFRGSMQRLVQCLMGQSKLTESELKHIEQYVQRKK